MRGTIQGAAFIMLAFASAIALSQEKSPLSQSQITGVVQGSMDAIKACYTVAVAKKPTLAGDLNVTFVVKADGSVADPKVQDTSTARQADFEACVLGAVKSLHFPKPGKKVVVNYPFSFASNTKDAPSAGGAESPDLEAVRATLHENRGTLLSCFGPDGKWDRDARIHMSFVLYPGGYAGEVKHDDQPTPAKTAIADCLVGRWKDLRFNDPKAGTTQVTVPLSVPFLQQTK
jgi:hypothetical protein